MKHRFVLALTDKGPVVCILPHLTHCLKNLEFFLHPFGFDILLLQTQILSNDLLSGIAYVMETTLRDTSVKLISIFNIIHEIYFKVLLFN